MVSPGNQSSIPSPNPLASQIGFLPPAGRAPGASRDQCHSPATAATWRRRQPRKVGARAARRRGRTGIAMSRGWWRGRGASAAARRLRYRSDRRERVMGTGCTQAARGPCGARYKEQRGHRLLSTPRRLHGGSRLPAPRPRSLAFAVGGSRSVHTPAPPTPLP